MIYINPKENNNKYEKDELEHEKTFDNIKSLLSKNLSRKKYIRKLKDSIKKIPPIKGTPSELHKLFSTFAELVKYFSITFYILLSS